jgi:hypothetical protein
VLSGNLLAFFHVGDIVAAKVKVGLVLTPCRVPIGRLEATARVQRGTDSFKARAAFGSGSVEFGLHQPDVNRSFRPPCNRYR